MATKRIKLSYLLIVVSSVVAATATEWLPLYISVVNFSSKSKFLDIKKFEKKCSNEVSPSSGMACKLRYVIPKKAWEDLNGDAGEELYLGAGFILSATVFSCGQDEKVSYGDQSSASRGLELLRTYQIFNHDLRTCRNDLEIVVFGPEEYLRVGRVGGQAVISTKSVVMSVKSAVDLVASGFDFLLCCLLFSVILLQRYFSRLHDGRRKSANQFLFNFISWWLLFGLFRSGLLEILLPFINDSLFLLRLKNYISMVALAGLALSIFLNFTHFQEKLDKGVWRKIRAIIFIACALPVFTSYYASALSAVLLFSLSLFMVSCIRHDYRSRTVVAPFFAFYLIEFLKLHNVISFGSGSTTFVYVTMSFVANYFAENSRMQKIAALSYIKKTTSISGESDLSKENSKIIEEILNDSVVDVFMLSEGMNFSSVVRCSNENGTLSIRKFANTRESSWLSAATFDGLQYLNVEPGSSSDLFYDFGSEDLRTVKKFFSVLPVSTGDTKITIIHHDEMLEISHLDEFEVVQLSSEMIGAISLEISNNRELVTRYKMDELIGSLISDLARLPDQIKDNDEIVAAALRAVSSRLQLACAILQYSSDDHALRVVGTSGFSPDGEQYFSKAGWRALPSNPNAPFSIALHRDKPVNVEDVRVLKNSFHEFTLKFFEIERIESFLLLPIRSGDETQRLLVWIHSNRSHQFPRGLQSQLVFLSESLSAFTKSAFERKKIAGRVRKYLPEAFSMGILTGAELNQAKTGLLMMVDIRNSTKTANLIGAENWMKFVEKITPKIESLTAAKNFKLVKVIWDAFFFTLECSEVGSESFRLAYDIACSIESLILEELKAQDVPFFSDTVTRICLEFGDISTGVHHGTYTVVGSSMANINKLEQESKKLNGWMFVCLGAYEPHLNFMKSSSSHPITGDKVWICARAELAQDKAAA